MLRCSFLAMGVAKSLVRFCDRHPREGWDLDSCFCRNYSCELIPIRSEIGNVVGLGVSQAK
jgi:hypothetical protein